MVGSGCTESGLVVTITLVGPACWVTASTLNVSISFWTAEAWTGCLNTRLYWSPPWKSIPSRKPKNSMDRIPGRMIASESRKYQLRRPTMFMGSATSSGGLGGLHAVEGEPARRPEPGHDLQELLGRHDRREHADRDADRQGDRKASDQRRPEEIKDEAGDQG